MKIFGIAAAALIALTGLASASIAAPASAQRTVVHERTVVRHGPAVRRGPVVRHRAARYRWRNRRVCDYRVRNHHRVRVCRSVRYRQRY